MKSLPLTLLVYFFFSFNLFSQFKPIHSYEPGQIIKKNNDTINCRIQLDQVDESDIAPLGEAYVDYKTYDNDKVLSIKTKEIKTIKAGVRTFQNITVDKTEFLFKVVVFGKVSLLQYPKISIIMERTAGGMINKFGPPDIRYYAIKTNEATYVIKQKKDVKSFIQIFENCPEAKAMVEDKSFKLEDLKLIVFKLNNCK
jgi:helix-turn-helix protein